MKTKKTYSLLDPEYLIDKYIKDILKLERQNLKLQQKISRLKSGSKKHHRDLIKKYNDENYDNKRKIDELTRENGELKLGLTHRNEIIHQIQKTDSIQEVHKILKNMWREE